MVHQIKKQPESKWLKTRNIGSKEFDLHKVGNKYVAYLNDLPFKVWNSKKDMLNWFRFHEMKFMMF